MLLVSGWSYPTDSESWQLPAEPTLLVYGDSISNGYRLPTAKGWVALFEKKVQNDPSCSVKVVNRSRNGETTKGGLARLPTVLNSVKPDLVLLELGGNDALRFLPPKHLIGNLEKMIKLVRDAQAIPALLAIEVPANFRPTGSGRALIPLYDEVADDLDVFLVPAAVGEVFSWADWHNKYSMSDGIHPNAAGHEVMAEHVWKFLHQSLGCSSKS